MISTRNSLVALIVFVFAACSPDQQLPVVDQEQNQIYELRVYHAAPGKLDSLHDRFRDHTIRLFEKHGITNVGYWVPIDNDENKLIFLLAYPDADSREAAFRSFREDPEWIAARDASQSEGMLVDSVESTFLRKVDYSPSIPPAETDRERTFALRIYEASPGKLDALNARFRNHTMDLFEKHGMEHIAYWVPTEPEQGSDNTLIYIIAHENREAMEASFASFRADPEWISAKDASEVDGILAANVQTTYMMPTDYSPLK